MRRLVLCLAVLAAALPVFAQDTFTLYTSFAEKDLPPLVGAFEKRYGIKVKVLSMDYISTAAKLPSPLANRRPSRTC